METKKAAIALKRNMVDIEEPTPIKVAVFPFIFNSLPTMYAVINAADNVKIIKIIVCFPTLKTLKRFMLNPIRIMEY